MTRNSVRSRIAVIGSGISGLSAAYLLGRRHEVVLYEADDRLGGHSNTLDADFAGRRVPVDTGFIVYNPRNYPNLVNLFAELGVPSENSDMSFAVSVGDGALEWSGTSVATLFAQPRNMLSPRFHGMWRDILRFNRLAIADLDGGRVDGLSLEAYLKAGRYGEAFTLDYLLPMGAAIWSSPMSEMMRFPARTFIRFFANHGLLTVNDRPQWRTVSGGSRTYVERIVARMSADIRRRTPVVAVSRDGGRTIVRDSAGHEDRFDHAVIAAHADQALAMLADADSSERELLSSFRFQENVAYLHRDEAQMPKRRRVWSSWNYQTEARRDLDRTVGLTYWMNKLQNIDPAYPLFVGLNPLRAPHPDKTFARITYQHPLFDEAAIQAQTRLGRIQGAGGVWYCGAWTGYGFHEDGLKSAIRVALSLGCAPDWRSDVLPWDGSADARPLQRAAE